MFLRRSGSGSAVAVCEAASAIEALGAETETIASSDMMLDRAAASALPVKIEF